VSSPATEVHVVVPDSIDDPAAPSGGNIYDRRVCDGLAAAGWSVREHLVAGVDALPTALARVPADAVVLLDGLLASAVPEVLEPHSHRLRVVVLMHMPLGQQEVGGASARDAECRVLSGATAVVTTSGWSRDWLLQHYPLTPDRVHVARPGTLTAEPAAGTASGGELLCVAAVTPNKGHDVLVEALALVGDLDWRCVCVGALDRDPEFVSRVHDLAEARDVAGRIRFAGPRRDDELDASYAAADALVLPTRVESYGMVVTEALARGLPVIATCAGGLPEALGELRDRRTPGLLVPPGDPGALATALRRWLSDDHLRRGLRDAAGARRASLTDWATTTRQVADVLMAVAP
jgi:glycosyltransferase involved in cell wall biosynthesis